MSPPARVSGDDRLLGRVVRNLVDNAVRHAADTVVVGLRTDGGGAVLTVDDDGHGVPEADRARVFERFVRLDEGRARDAGGSGLGLAIVDAVVRGHGGSVTVSAAPTGGSAVHGAAAAAAGLKRRRPAARASPQVASGLLQCPLPRVVTCRPRRRPPPAASRSSPHSRSSGPWRSPAARPTTTTATTSPHRQPPLRQPPRPRAAPVPAPPASGSAAGNDALTAAAGTARKAVGSGTVTSIEQEAGGTSWEVLVVTSDGNEQEVHVDADGQRTTAGPTKETSDAEDVTEAKRFVGAADLSVAQAASTLTKTVSGTVTELGLDDHAGAVVWEGDVLDGSGTKHSIRIDAGSGEVVTNTVDTED
ncbi:ATP-binding protein [Curtobacterium sp. MCPF17_052]|uniref:ATP-binding protein n=1 Tax=Curtobacterium sp. MCPF17_052 TaxID=2175655 RepID=UPI0024E03967|nr:ATP-binding protein [Curtobacterium sp. MCPF17_052]WIB13763.1 ATP-binding protein [Curtobacterium sp. MCPF17_052]